MIRRSAQFLALMALAISGCSETADPVRYTATIDVKAARISIPVQTVALREVSLPTYASEEGIAVSDATGAIVSSADSIWADDPTRAVTLRLANALADMTGRTVAAEPWPLRDDPEAVVEVRVEDFVADAGGQFVARGRIYVAHEDLDRDDKSISFRITERFDISEGYAAIAAARARVINSLASEIARRGLR